jgi:hypothetical protein
MKENRNDDLMVVENEDLDVTYLDPEEDDGTDTSALLIAGGIGAILGFGVSKLGGFAVKKIKKARKDHLAKQAVKYQEMVDAGEYDEDFNEELEDEEPEKKSEETPVEEKPEKKTKK